MPQLRYIDDQGTLQMVSLDSEHFVIGRSEACQISFDDDMISREHLCIDMETDGRYRLRDLGSRNRSFVNGELITETLLMPGDIIRVGEHVVEYVDTASPQEKFDLEFLTPDRSDPPNSEWVKVKAPISLTSAQIEQLSQLWVDQPMLIRPEDIAQSALSTMLLNVQGERGFIALRGESKMDLRPLAQRALKRPAGGSLTPVSQSFVLAPFLQSVAGRYPQTASKLDSKLGYAATALIAPLTFKGEIVGILYIDRPQSKKPFPASSLQICLAAGAQIGAMLGESSRRIARAAAREGVAWMTTIRRVQTALSCTVSSSDTFDVDHARFSGRVRCGDFCDVVHLDEQRCGMFVVDGGGHGITGIVQACSLRSAVRAALAVSDEVLMDPSVLFNELNRITASAPSRQVIPCAYLGVDMASGKLAYINAGGTPPMLMVAPGRLVTLDQSSLVLGIDADYLYDATRVDLPERYRVICHTDGLTEATSGAGEPLGAQRLHDTLLDRAAFTSATDLVARITQTWTTHLSGTTPDDDALVLVLSRG